MKNISILIVDDNEADRYLLKRQINEIGLEISIFENDDGLTALEFLGEYDAHCLKFPNKFPPIIIFLDINMPLVDGFEFLKKFAALRTKFYLSNCIVMVFTSSEHESDKNKALAYEFVSDYLVKGAVTTEILKEKIMYIVRNLN